jgi:tetratricopeptide (TPR) repeat protein
VITGWWIEKPLLKRIGKSAELFELRHNGSGICEARPQKTDEIWKLAVETACMGGCRLSEMMEIRKRAHEYAQNGELDKALDEYRTLLKGDNVDPNIYNLMGDILFKKGQAEEAFHQYHEAVKRYGKDSLFSNAIAVCRKMLRLDSTCIDAHRLLGELYLEQGFAGEAVGHFLEYVSKLIDKNDRKRAAEVLRKVIESAPGSVKIREQLADVYMHLNLIDEARSELLAASEIYREKGDRQMAGELRSKAEHLFASSSPETTEASVEGGGTDRVEIVHKRIGLAHHVPIKVDEVLRSFQDEVKKAIGDEDYQSHYDLGMAYLELEFYDEALAEFGVSRKHSELALRSIEMAGRCFMEKGDVELAIEELKSGLEMEGHSEAEYLGLRYNLAMGYEKLGEYEAAFEHYEEICRTDPTFRDARIRLEEMRKTE